MPIVRNSRQQALSKKPAKVPLRLGKRANQASDTSEATTYSSSGTSLSSASDSASDGTSYYTSTSKTASSKDDRCSNCGHKPCREEPSPKKMKATIGDSTGTICKSCHYVFKKKGYKTKSPSSINARPAAKSFVSGSSVTERAKVPSNALSNISSVTYQRSDELSDKSVAPTKYMRHENESIMSDIDMPLPVSNRRFGMLTKKTNSNSTVDALATARGANAKKWTGLKFKDSIVESNWMRPHKTALVPHKIKKEK